MADVGVHSYITTKDSSTSSELLYSVFKNHIFSHMKTIFSLGDIYYFVFHGHWLRGFFFDCFGTRRSVASTLLNFK